MIVNTQEIRNHRITKIQISNEMYIEVSSRDAIITVQQNENTSAVSYTHLTLPTICSV